MENNEKVTLKKVMIICSKGSIEDVYAALVMGNGAVMEGIEAKLFWQLFPIILKKMYVVGFEVIRMFRKMPWFTHQPVLFGIMLCNTGKVFEFMGKLAFQDLTITKPGHPFITV